MSHTTASAVREHLDALDPDAPAVPVPGDVARARPITFAEIEALLDGHASSIRLYREAAGLLTPATLTVTGPRTSSVTRRLAERVRRQTGRRSRSPRASSADEEPVPFYFEAENGAYFAAVADPAAPDTFTADVAGGPVGYGLTVEITLDTGSTWTTEVFTSAEAEDSAAKVDGMRAPDEARRCLFVHDPNGTLTVPLQPYFGASATVSANIAGIDPDEAKARIEKALRAEFGDDLRRLLDVRARPVTDDLHDVFDAETDRIIALGILGTEVPQFMRRPGYIQTRPASGTDVVMGA